MAERPRRTFLYLAVGVFAISWAAPLIRLCEAPPLAIATYRMGFSALLLLPLALKDCVRELKPQGVLTLFLPGAFLGLHFALWVSSLSYTSVASSVILVTTNPIFVGVLSFFLLRERMTRPLLLGTALAIAGGITVGVGDFREGEGLLLGNGLALAGALMMSCYLVAGRSLRQRASLLSYVFVVYGAAALFLLLLSLLLGEALRGFPLTTWVLFLLLALVPTLLGHSTINWAVRYLSTPVVVLAIVGEPVLASLLAYLVLGESLTWPRVVGGAVILAGVYLGIFRRRG